MKRKSVFITIVLILVICFSTVVWAAVDIVLNGSFTDWADKPSLTDPTGGIASGIDIKMVQWYPDNVNGNLYLYAERLAHNNTDWDFTVYLTGDLGTRRAEISYRRANSTVVVQVYDSTNKRILNTSGKWGDSKNVGTKVEFSIPLAMLVSTTTGGYQINIYIESGTDRAPDAGVITISSVSTAPIIMVTGAIVLNVLFVAYRRKYRVKS